MAAHEVGEVHQTMTPIAYAKLGAVLLAVVLLFGGGWYFRGLKCEAAAATVSQAQSAAVATAVLAERASTAAELVRVNTVLKGYQENAALNPVDVGLAHRVYVYAHATECSMPAAGAHPAATGSASQEPRGDPGFVGLAQAAIDACAQDAAELTALQQAWPR